MTVSMTKSATAALIVGGALLLGTLNARAQNDAFEDALNQCQDVSKGQRSFCMINAYNQHQANTAMAQKKDVVVHHDYDTSNDTPAQTQAKTTFSQAVDKCGDLPKGQRSFCMINAGQAYNQGMGW